jgi:hypothetical protein
MFVDDMSVTLSASPSLDITNFTPATGKAGTVVTVNGTNFLDLTEVLFNGVAASFAVQSDSALTVTVPAEASTGAITLKTAYSTVNSAEVFTVLQSLTADKAGTGSGTVTSVPAGISCGADCTQDYDHGTEVTLSAEPAVDSIFAGWSGACTGNATDCIVDMNATKSVTAIFNLNSLALLTTSTVGNGLITSEPAGVNCGADCSESYLTNTEVELTAQPAADSIFVGWGGACTGNAANCPVLMDAAKRVTATFELNPFDLNVNKIGNGTVSSTPTGIDCGIDCTESYLPATQVTLTAQPAADSLFTGWGGACSGTSTTCALTLDDAKDVTATFELKSFTLSVTKSGTGGGTITSEPAGISCGSECSNSFTTNTTVTLSAQPDSNSLFAGWGGACTGEQLTCEFLLSEVATVSATFTLADTNEGTYLPLIKP